MGKVTALIRWQPRLEVCTLQSIFKYNVSPEESKKIESIKSLIEKQTPCLISLALGRGNGWHIMPVVQIDDTTIEMIHHADASGNHIWRFPIATIVWRHDNLEGGNDISWIDPT